jgi:probable phosphoglycerate mutase
MTTTTRLIIARHGNTFAPGDIVTRVGTTDLPLVESGLQQGRMLGAHLRDHHLVPDVIFTSELQRAIQTAGQAQSVMHTAHNIKPLSIFNEIDYGPDENQPEEKVVVRIGKDALKAWESDAIVPAGWRVKPDEIIQHWLQFAETLRAEYAGKTILVVTSNGIARFAPHLTGDFTAFAREHNIKIATGAFAVFENSGDQSWQCVQWNVKPAAA